MLDFTKFNQFKKEIEGKKVLILGLGLQGGGVGAVKFFNEMKCRLRVTDLRKEESLQPSLQKINNIKIEKFIFETHKTDDVDWADIILLNPGVPQQSEIVKYAISRAKTIFMEEALFTSLCPVDTIGVTGTRGKTTTTTLIGELLMRKFKPKIAGNIPGSETLMLLFDIKSEEEKVVMELSSFQLFGFHRLKVSPHVGVITNIYEDHLNVYKNMEEYVYDKKAIYLYQNKKPYEDYLVINKNLISKDSNEKFSIYFRDYFTAGNKGNCWLFQQSDISRFEISLTGDHNRENFAAAYSVAAIYEIPDESIKSVFKTFKGVPFRQEKIATINGVIYINDTTASTPVAAIKALLAFSQNKIILICGGNSKNCYTKEFANLVAEKCKYVIFLKGDATSDFRNEILNSGLDASRLSEIFIDFRKAIETAKQKSNKGDIILLSPGFTSFGMFVNEFERGRQFNEIVAYL